MEKDYNFEELAPGMTYFMHLFSQKQREKIQVWLSENSSSEGLSYEAQALYGLAIEITRDSLK